MYEDLSIKRTWVGWLCIDSHKTQGLGLNSQFCVLDVTNSSIVHNILQCIAHWKDNLHIDYWAWFLEYCGGSFHSVTDVVVDHGNKCLWTLLLYLLLSLSFSVVMRLVGLWMPIMCISLHHLWAFVYVTCVHVFTPYASFCECQSCGLLFYSKRICHQFRCWEFFFSILIRLFISTL